MNLGSETPIRMNLWTLIAVIGFAIIQVSKFTTYKNTIDNKVASLEKENTHQEECIKGLTEKVNGADVTFMEIRTKLANIETLLMEMKTQIKNKK